VKSVDDVTVVTVTVAFPELLYQAHDFAAVGADKLSSFGVND
jgi:hypothetical protein